MSSSTAEFDLKLDYEKEKKEYILKNPVNRIYLYDSNQYEYVNNYVRFNMYNIQGSTSKTLYEFPSSTCYIPVTVFLSLTNGAFQVANRAKFGEYLYLKNSLSIINQIYLKLGGVDLVKSMQNRTMYNLLILHNMRDEKLKYLGPTLLYHKDSSETYTIDTTLGEINNNVSGNVPNEGLIYRNYYNNFINISDTTNIYNKLGLQNNLKIQNNNIISEILDSSGNITGLRYQMMIEIPMYLLTEAVKNSASFYNLNDLNFELQLNVGGGNKSVVNFGASTATNAYSSITSWTSSMNVGSIFPFMIPDITTLDIECLANGTGSLEISTYIGYVNTIGGAPGTQPAFVEIPTYDFVNELKSSITESNRYKNVIYRDIWYSETKNITTNNYNFRQTLQNNTARNRRIFIVPFINSIGANSNLQPYKSPLSPAPMTCSKVILNNFQIWLGDQTLFKNPLNYTYEFFNQNFFQMEGDEMNGNSLRSDFFYGEISKYDWNNNYGYYMFNLDVKGNNVDDSSPYNITLTFDVLGNGSYTVDFLFFVEYENHYKLDRVDGVIGQ